MTAQEMLQGAVKAVKRGDIKRAWAIFNQIPDCPQCKGDGEPHGGISDLIYWRGEPVEVCANCKGHGKV